MKYVRKGPRPCSRCGGRVWDQVYRTAGNYDKCRVCGQIVNVVTLSREVPVQS